MTLNSVNLAEVKQSWSWRCLMCEVFPLRCHLRSVTLQRFAWGNFRARLSHKTIATKSKLTLLRSAVSAQTYLRNAHKCRLCTASNSIMNSSAVSARSTCNDEAWHALMKHGKQLDKPNSSRLQSQNFPNTFPAAQNVFPLILHFSKPAFCDILKITLCLFLVLGTQHICTMHSTPTITTRKTGHSKRTHGVPLECHFWDGCVTSEHI